MKLNSKQPTKNTNLNKGGNVAKNNKKKNNRGTLTNTKVDKSRKKRSVKPSVSKSRVSQISSELKKLWEIDVRAKNDDFIVNCITGKFTTDVSYWPSLRIQRARTITALGTKIKTSEPLRSDSETIREFIKTQEDPILGARYCTLLKDHIQEVFAEFDYEGIKARITDPERTRIVTNGAAYPPLMAPVITGIHGNAEMIAAMSVGRDIFKPDFDSRLVFEGLASGRVTTVPKNYKTSRVITITNRNIIDQQQVVSNALRDYVTLRSRKTNHIIQFDDQSVQHKLLVEGNATLDLSSASDRVYRSLIEEVWPEFMTHFGEYLPESVITDDGKLVELKCIGTQGYPLTFTMMAIICGLIVESTKFSHKPSSNYGDDIIVSEGDFNEVYTALQSLGLVINKDKTHKSSSGFLESCGMDVMFTKYGRREITPIHLRGESDVETIQFFHQLCDAGLIDSSDATSIMSRLGVEFYAFDHEFQETEFHFPHGDVINVPRAKWSPTKTHYVCVVPAIKQEVESIKGLSKKDSQTVLHLLHLEAQLKNDSAINVKTVRGTDPVPRQYGLTDIQDDRLYNLLVSLDNADTQILLHYQELENVYNVSFKALITYRFITSEMNRYKYSTPTVDFSSTPVQLSLSEFIESEFGVKSELIYPIYRYKKTKSTKTILHPKSNLILGV